MRKRLFEVIESAKEGDLFSKIYDITMVVAIIISIVPLMTKSENSLLMLSDKITVCVFIIDYFLRFITADYKLNKGWRSFLCYPFTFMAIVDLLSILPSLTFLSRGLRVLKVIRLMRTLKVLRIFKAIRYSRNIELIIKVFRQQKDNLTVVCGLAICYVLISALVIFNVEPDTFNTFFDAIYWATVSLTTVGYGDIFAVSTVGKVITMVSAIFGIAVVALPAGIITAGYIDELNKDDRERNSA